MYALREKMLGKLSSSLHQQYIEECNYWKNVLKHIMSVIKFLGVRGLAYREECEKFGLRNNENYLGFLEFLVEFNPFL